MSAWLQMHVGAGGLGLFAGLAVLLLICLHWRLRRELRELLQQKNVIFNFVHDVSEAFADSTSLEVDLLLKRVLFYAQQTVLARTGAVYCMEPDGASLRARVVAGFFPPLAANGPPVPESATYQQLEARVMDERIALGDGLVGKVAEQGLPILIADAERDPRVPSFTSEFLRIRTILLVPMRFRKKVLGVLAVVNRIDDTAFIQADLNLLQSLADQASITIFFAQFNEELARKRLLDYDLQVAHRIQKDLLPARLPEIRGLDLAAFSAPAREVGGDFYDFIPVDDEHLGLTIADASGKGVPGAIFISICRSVFRAHAPGCLSPAQVLKAVNSTISGDMHEDMFISMLYLIVNRKTLAIRLARAGHTKPFLVSARDRRIIPIESQGLAIGLADPPTFNARLEEISIGLNAGDSLVSYTDGVVEALDRRNEEWGLARLRQTALAQTDADARAMVTAIRQALHTFTGGTPLYDDLTLLVLHRSTDSKDKP